MSAAAELKPLVKSLNSASTDEVRYGSSYDVPVQLLFSPSSDIADAILHAGPV